VLSDSRARYAYVVLDGTLILSTGSPRTARSTPASTAKDGMNLQVIANSGGDILWVSGALPGSVQTRRPSGSGTSWPSWRPPGWSPWPIRATREARTREPRTGEGRSRNHRNRPTAPTRSSAHPASARTPSLRRGTSSESSAAAPGAPGKLAKAIHVLQVREASRMKRAHCILFEIPQGFRAEERMVATSRACSICNGDNL
jgi:hypothetical protein